MGDREHWADRLGMGIPSAATAVILPVDTHTDPAGVLMILSRIGAVLDAMRTPSTSSADALAAESADTLAALLDHVHRVRMVMEGFEERTLLAAHAAGVSLRSLAAVLGVSSPETVRYRMVKIAQANMNGFTAAAYDDDPLTTPPLGN